jgi:hypothetical protein
MAALKDELRRVILEFVVNTAEPTLPLCIKACRLCFSDAEVKTAVDEMIKDGTLIAEGGLVNVAGEVVATVRLRRA